MATRLSCLKQAQAAVPDADPPTADKSTVDFAAAQVRKGKSRTALQALQGDTTAKAPATELFDKIQSQLALQPSEAMEARKPPAPLTADESMMFIQLFCVEPEAPETSKRIVPALAEYRRHRAADAFGLTREAVACFLSHAEGALSILVDFYRAAAAGWIPPMLLSFLTLARRLGI